MTFVVSNHVRFGGFHEDSIIFVARFSMVLQHHSKMISEILGLVVAPTQAEIYMFVKLDSISPKDRCENSGNDDDF